MASNNFTVYDYLVLLFILAISMLIGFYFGFKSKLKNLMTRNKITDKNEEIELKETNDSNEKSQVSEYLTANSSMNPLPVALSMLATFYSATALLGMVKFFYLNPQIILSH